MSGEKIGVYLCRCGGNIGDVVDVGRIADEVSGMDGVAHASVQDYLCSSAGQGQIESDIVAGTIDRVVIGSCSPKLHLETFRAMAEKAGINPMLLEITNIREQCSWVHDDNEEATRKAMGLVRGAVSRMQNLESLQPITKDLKDRVLVVGAGIAGITAALEMADDREVILIEKSPYIGGQMIGLSKTFPTLDCSQCILTPKMVSVFNHPNITLYTQTEVASVDGTVGDYRVTLHRMPRYVDAIACTSCGRCAEKCPKGAIMLPFAQAIPQAYIIDMEKCIECGACEKVCSAGAVKLDDIEGEIQVDCGAITIATGFDPIDPSIIEEYHYREHPDIITAIEFEEMLSAKSKTGMRLQKSDGTFPEKVAFVLCVGSRDFNRGNKHCSKVCCLYSQKQAQLVLKMNPDADVTVFYIDMRAAGRRMEEFYHHAQELGVNFVRGRVAEVNPLGDKLQVRYEDTFLGEIGKADFDMVVLCPSLIPSEGSRELADMLGVPVGSDGFVEEKHVKIDPVNTLNQGVFVAGCAVGPKDIHDSVTEAIGAAHKIHRFLGKGMISISPEKPVISDACDGCGVCVTECPYDALAMVDEGGKPILDPLSCNACGICAAVCPREAVEIANYTRGELKAQAEGILAAGMGVIVYIDPAAYAAADLAGVNRTQYSPLIRFIQVPSIHLLDAGIVGHAFESGAGGVMLIEGTTDEALTSRSKDLYSRLKKETKAFKLPIRYSHIETAQYEKLMNLLNVFSEQVAAKAARGAKKRNER
ncbi:MAG TPA: 4Fe-4S dicluster domain-containing protein [Methanosarcinales archaeon]|nr:4Fe-4S dicluster domain-containing protein [Methanosarcinales archaeon]